MEYQSESPSGSGRWRQLRAAIVASSPAEAQQAFDKLGGPVVLKSQIHAGGRGSGSFQG